MILHLFPFQHSTFVFSLIVFILCPPSTPPLGVTLKADNLIVGRSADKLPGQRLRAVGARVALLVVVLPLASHQVCLRRSSVHDTLVTTDALCCLVLGVARLTIHRSAGYEKGNAFKSDVTKRTT